MKVHSDLRILLVEDNEVDKQLTIRELRRSQISHTFMWVDNRKDFETQIILFNPTIILCDFSLPQFGALEALRILKEKNLNIPLIIVTGTLTDETAVECLRSGATDYVIKDKIVRLPSAIKRAIDLFASKQQKEAAEKDLRLITNALPALVMYISHDFSVRFCNKIKNEWFKSEILGRHIKDIVGTQGFDFIEKNRDKILGGEPISFDGRLSGEGGPETVNIQLVPDPDANSFEKGFVCLITDITDRKRHETELSAAKLEADTANQAKSQFLANMSHEIRTPLNVIFGLSELLLSNSAEAPERMTWIEKIMRNCEHLKKVIDEVLDLSKIEAGRLETECEPIHIPQVILQIKSLLLPLAQNKNIDLVFSIDGLIPEQIESDSKMLRHILLNLIGNAIKFSNAGPVSLKVNFHQEGTHPKLVFLIKDRGQGMSKEETEHLFEPFMQADNSMTRKFGGTGLGLALARKFAHALGGEVRLIESTPGVGSTFEVQIVAKATTSQMTDSLAPVIVSANVEPSHAEPIDIAGTNILVVDDCVDNQMLIRVLLEKEKVNIELASDGEEGMRKAVAGDYDLILMDIQMPVLDGYHATGRLRQQGYEKPIVAFTAHAFKAERDRCLKVGFSDFLTKPIKKSELIEQISKYKKKPA